MLSYIYVVAELYLCFFSLSIGIRSENRMGSIKKLICMSLSLIPVLNLCFYVVDFAYIFINTSCLIIRLVSHVAHILEMMQKTINSILFTDFLNILKSKRFASSRFCFSILFIERNCMLSAVHLLLHAESSTSKLKVQLLTPRFLSKTKYGPCCCYFLLS